MKKRKKILLGVLIFALVAFVILGAVVFNEDVLIKGILKLYRTSPNSQEIQFGSSSNKLAYDPTNGFNFSQSVKVNGNIEVNQQITSQSSGDLIIESGGDVIIRLGQ